jgi:type II secretory pathway pseudopilin PulG
MSAGRWALLAPLIRGVARSAGGFFQQRNPRVHKAKGFTYIGFLIAIAIAGAGLAAYAEIASHAGQREKEAELLFRGNAFQAAIASYYKKERRYPQSLDDLLQDNRHPMPVRHLRKLYPDPMTGAADWVLVEAPGGGVMGVHSRSESAPIKTGNFRLENQGFESAERYTAWKFVHSPAGPSPGIAKSSGK